MQEETVSQEQSAGGGDRRGRVGVRGVGVEEGYFQF